jgi:hypothetical protein
VPLVLAGCASTTAYAALVNGSVISESSINQELTDISHNQLFVKAIDQQSQTKVEGAGPRSYNKVFVAEVLTGRIEYELVHQELARRNALPGSSELQQAQPVVVQRYSLQNPGDLYHAFPTGYQDTLVRRQAEVTALQSAVPGQQAFNELINKLVQMAEIKVSPEFGTFDKQGNSAAGTGPSVVPPPVPNPPSAG